jgi:hypothetical protein
MGISFLATSSLRQTSLLIFYAAIAQWKKNLETRKTEDGLL